MADDEILVDEWLADDLQVKAGDAVDLTYFLAESGAQLDRADESFPGASCRAALGRAW